MQELSHLLNRFEKVTYYKSKFLPQLLLYFAPSLTFKVRHRKWSFYEIVKVLATLKTKSLLLQCGNLCYIYTKCTCTCVQIAIIHYVHFSTRANNWWMNLSISKNYLQFIHIYTELKMSKQYFFLYRIPVSSVNCPCNNALKLNKIVNNRETCVHYFCYYGNPSVNI